MQRTTNRLVRAGSATALLFAFALALALAGLSMPMSVRAQTGGDPYGSYQWPDLRREFLGADATVRFDARVRVLAPPFAEDPMNVPVTVAVDALADVERIVVLVDRNPIRKVVEYAPLAALPTISLRFKLEQASPVRAAVRTRDGVWHVGGTLVDSAGGGCTAAGETRRDGSWSRTLGTVSARVFPHSVPPAASGAAPATRVRLRVMHPMDTGLVGGIPAFYVNRLVLIDASGRELMKLDAYEPVSENPVFSVDFAEPPPGPLRLVGTDNNGNRIRGAVP